MMASGDTGKSENLVINADPVQHPVKGIRNHGNTCYFNAMLQAVNQTNELHNLYVMKPYKKQYSIKDKEYSVSTSQPNKVAETLSHILHRFDSGNQRVESTRSLLNILGKRHPRFVQGTQEDSHEVLRALLDDIKNEEVENIKKEIRLQFDAACDATQQDGEHNLELKSHLRMASKVDIAISKAVQGSVVSAVICHDCHSVVENIEPFFDLSLPICLKSSAEERLVSTGDEGDDCENSVVVPEHSRKRKARCTEDGQLKKQKTQNDDDSSQAIVHDKNVFQKHLKENGYKYQYSHTAIDHTDLEHCLSTFTDLDVLDEDNKFICKHCTERKQPLTCSVEDNQLSNTDGNETTYALCRVSKQLMIHQLPPVLILHIKRFEIGHYRVTKDSRYVSFPEILDLAQYCTVKCVEERGDLNNQILYGLYAVVVHHGSSLYSGHYVSYVKARPRKEENKLDDDCFRTKFDEDYCKKGQWHLANDTFVHECQFEEVKDVEAYMLFYELLPRIKHHHQIAIPSDETILL